MLERVHQEDFCQATGMAPSKKYQEDGGPSLRRIAGVLWANDPSGLERLVRAVTLNVLVGNGDAHAKNLSLLHEASGKLRLAPIYDVMSTLVYGDNRLAMYVDDVQRTDRVTAERIVNEAIAWGLSRPRASDAVEEEILNGLPAAMGRAADETPNVPASILEIVGSQAAALRGRPATRRQ